MRFANVTGGNPSCTNTTSPPSSANALVSTVSAGTTATAASTRGTTRKRTGSRPIVESASISSLTFIVPISAANAEPERAVSRIAAISGPSSRSIEIPSRSATKISAPKRCIGIAPWKARIRPSRKPTSATIGTAPIPARSATVTASRKRSSPGWRSGAHHEDGEFSDERDQRAQIRHDFESRAAQTREERGWLRGLRSRRGFRRAQHRDDLAELVAQTLDREGAARRALLALDRDQQRGPGGVAVRESARVHDERVAAGAARRQHRLAPERARRIHVEMAGEDQAQSARVVAFGSEPCSRSGPGRRCGVASHGARVSAIAFGRARARGGDAADSGQSSWQSVQCP